MFKDTGKLKVEDIAKCIEKYFRNKVLERNINANQPLVNQEIVDYFSLGQEMEEFLRYIMLTFMILEREYRFLNIARFLKNSSSFFDNINTCIQAYINLAVSHRNRVSNLL